MSRNSQNAFTLIELSMVLVIIGLIVGGVLIGQDLIKNAEDKAVMNQMQRLQAALGSFKSTFAGYPGDHATADTFLSGVSATQIGNGDGLIGITSAGTFPIAVAAGNTLPTAEVVYAFLHLGAAGMVEGTFSGTAANGIINGTTIPMAKNNKGGVALYGDPAALSNFLQFGILGVAAGGNLSNQMIFSSKSAYNIDSKLDDGMPNTGTLVAQGGATVGAANPAGFTAAAGTAGACVVTTSLVYNITAQGNVCSLRFKFD